MFTIKTFARNGGLSLLEAYKVEVTDCVDIEGYMCPVIYAYHDSGVSEAITVYHDGVEADRSAVRSAFIENDSGQTTERVEAKA